MKRTFLALGAIVAVCAGTAGTAQASFGDGEWLQNAFRGNERPAASASSQRRQARQSTRVASQATADPAPQQRAARSQPALPSLTGGGYQSGIASYYWQPQRVASGGWFNPNAMTAAHKTLPFGTRVRVTNLNNGSATTVTINDRGPYVAGRIIDLSSAAAGAVGMKGAGLARVKLDILGR